MKHFDTFGIMIDCSRNAVMTVGELKKFISLVSKMGYNQLQLYTEDTYEIEGEPFFGYKRGRYSEKELKEIDEFASSLGVEMVPNIQTLAHLNCIMRWPEYDEIKDIDDILLAGDERTYELIDKMIASARKCFKSNRIHIGMDEAFKLGKGKYLDINGARDRSEILVEHLGRVCEIAEKYGFKPMMWSDMFYRLANNGVYRVKNSNINPEISKMIPKNLQLVYWDYYTTDKELQEAMFDGHKVICDDIVFGAGADKWNGLVPRNHVSLKAMDVAMRVCVEKGVREAFVTTWGDNGAEASIYSVLPTFAHLACLADGITDIDEIKKKFYEWTGYSYDDFMLLDMPDKFEDGVNLTPSKYELYNDCFLGIYDKNVEDGDAQHFAHCAKVLEEASERTGEYSYIFQTEAKLCNLLAIKADIGIRTREAYLAKDMDSLKAICEQYGEMLKRADEFYYAFKTQWLKENKPNGFEVQDIRLGGLMMRIRNCKERLEDYINGVVDAIPELDEETLVITQEGHIRLNKWERSVTVGRMR